MNQNNMKQIEDSEDEFDEMEEQDTYHDLRIKSLDLAIKSASISLSIKEPEQILKIAEDFFKFITGADEE
jgi:hypothetical protein